MGKRGSRAAGVALVSTVVLICCIRANTVECGDLACPEALQCLANRCVTDDQVTACVDHAAGETCSAGGVINGHCVDGACVDSICGNGVVDLGKSCDDGNTIGEDGCSERCDSNELCGNDVVDLFREQCDEGIGTLSGDGCSSRCAVEYPTWQREIPRELNGRYDQAVVAIPGATPEASRILMFGGTGAGGLLLSDTWEWNGLQWRQLQPRTVPPPRSNAAMVYDAARKRVVLIHGGGRRDVWEWDGVDWTDKTPTSIGPIPQNLTPVAGYHAATGQVICYDGTSTFRWTGSAWIQLAIASPPYRDNTVMAYLAKTPTSGDLIVFGGTAGNARLGDTWAFDGTSWRQVFGNGPPAREMAMMATDLKSNQLVMFGGRDLVALRTDTWTFDGTWTQVPGTTTGRRSGRAVYDGTAGSVMVIHGLSTAGAFPLDDQIRFQTATWFSIGGAAGLKTGCESSFAYMPGTQQSVIVAGDGVALSWDGIQWITPSNQPSTRCAASTAALPGGDRVVLYGGLLVGQGSGTDTWSWDGLGWKMLSVPGPPTRSFAAMAPDPRRGTAVLVGGRGAPGSSGTGSAAVVYDDTWDWNGSAWAERATNPGPRRHRHGLAYDRTTGTIVLYGGAAVDLGAASRETWELDGGTWKNLGTTNGPMITTQVMMTTGPRGRPILVDPARTTWELRRDATGQAEWFILPTIGVPPVMSFESITYDAARDGLVLVGSANNDVQVWTLTYLSPQPRESCVATDDRDEDGARGCADPDCWSTCDPVCSPYETAACAPARPRCGDGVCTVIEDYVTCPADCPAP